MQLDLTMVKVIKIFLSVLSWLPLERVMDGNVWQTQIFNANRPALRNFLIYS